MLRRLREHQDRCALGDGDIHYARLVAGEGACLVQGHGADRAELLESGAGLMTTPSLLAEPIEEMTVTDGDRGERREAATSTTRAFDPGHRISP